MRRLVLWCGVVLLLWWLWWAGSLLFGSSLAQQAPPLHIAAVLSLGSQPDDTAYTVTGAPTITAAFINQVLAAYHSPAAGTGQALYDLGVQYSIDPVYALAFFRHEDSFGTTGIGAVNHSLGNSRCYGWRVCRGGYRSYATWAEGYQDWYNLILNGYVRGQVKLPIAGHVCTTVSQIVPVYAPSRDHNNVAGYIAAVEHAVDTWRIGKMWV